MTNYITRLQGYILRIIEVQAADPDDARRRKVLNQILLSTLLVTLIIEIMVVIGVKTGDLAFTPAPSITYSAAMTVAGLGGIYVLNRRVSGNLAGTLFVLFLMLILASADEIPELVDGQSTFLFMVPILVSSLVLGSGATFIFYALVTGEVILLSWIGDVAPNLPSLAAFLLLTVLSWLSSRDLEQTLRELRKINADLDKLVAERTQELAIMLGRHQAQVSQLEVILNSIVDGVIVFDATEIPRLANMAAGRILGIPLNKLANYTLGELVKLNNVKDQEREMLVNLRWDGEFPRSFRLHWGEKILACTSSKISGDVSEAVGIVTVFRDVTREAELERIKRSFIAMVSHELRTPLGAITGFAEMLREGIYGPVTEKQMEVSDRILGNADHMLDMVNDLLDQSQIEAGRLRISMEPVRPAQMLKTIQEAVEDKIRAKSLTITGEVDPLLPDFIQGDPQRLKQILLNLVINAINFTDAGGIDIHFQLSGPSSWDIIVRDTGQGIPEEEIEHIFEPFHQVQSLTTRQKGGFGLGLSIVKQLAELMEGEIHVQSTLGKGSTFTITLPLIGQQLERNTIMGLSALIVEDDPDLASIFEEALKTTGFETRVISDGAVAQGAIRDLCPQVVVLDLHLPHVDGSTILTRMRSDPLLRGTIVIITTADAALGEKYRQLAEIVLIKPISFVQLRDIGSGLRKVLLSEGTK